MQYWKFSELRKKKEISYEKIKKADMKMKKDK